jgi:hypothetical protein
MVRGRDLGRDVDITEALEAVKEHSTPNSRLVAAYAHLQGFDGPPRVGTAADLDAEIEAGGIELWRGIHQRGRDGQTLSRREKRKISLQQAEQFRTGPAYYGEGTHGNGIYTGMNREKVSAWAQPDMGGVMIRMVLHRDAVIASGLEMARLAREEYEQTGVFIDPGALAARLGYDAMHVEGRDYIVIFNRTAVIVEKA